MDSCVFLSHYSWTWALVLQDFLPLDVDARNVKQCSNVLSKCPVVYLPAACPKCSQQGDGRMSVKFYHFFK